ncbi:MAG: tripartite tricarboxylate transporter substrate binding protein [Betaproteobacteria bacterium]|nr:tripartite tricarboxylate transporter substrate binding protein [Betaproteobacteria bacterium]
MGLFLRMASLGMAAMVWTLPSTAQDYPAKPIRIIHSYPAGGGSDTMARILAQKMSQDFRQQVIIDNKPGGNTVISADLAAHSAPDGYTLLMGMNSTMTMNAAMLGKLPYDAEKDFAPISGVAAIGSVLVTHPNTPFKTMQELIAYAKANPGKLNYGASAAITQLVAFQLMSASGINMVFVPYRGAADFMRALLGEQIDLVVDGISSYVSQVRSGKLRALATTGATRDAQMPDVPTVGELGFPQMEGLAWYGLYAPAGTPAAIIDKLNAGVVRALADPEVREKLANLGYTTIPGTPAQLAAAVKAEIARWTPVIKAANIKL